MKRKTETEVLIVGAGPVGLLTAIFLTEAKIAVQIIDRASGPVAQTGSCGLHAGSLALLQAVHVLEPLVEVGHRIETIGFYEGVNRVAEVALAELKSDFPYVLALPQATLERLLERRLEQSKGNHVLWDHRLSKLETKGRVVVATIEKLGMDAKGYAVPVVDWVVQSEREIHANFVVGADGPHSLVGYACDIEDDTFGPNELFSVCDIQADAVSGNEARVILEKGGQLGMLWPLSRESGRWILPTTEVAGSTESGVKVRNAVLVEPAEETSRFERAIQKRAPWFTQSVTGMRGQAAVPFQFRLARSYGRGCCWLAGDAAHEGSPLGMQSMNAGLEDAAELAETLIQILRRNASANLLQSYGRNRRNRWQNLVELQQWVQPGNQTCPALRPCWPRIPYCLPALGQDLILLLHQLGTESTPESREKILTYSSCS